MSKTKYISSVWEFENGVDEYSIHKTIRWYGKLPQKLVRKLIPMYSNKNDLIMANFAGSGTVLTESNVSNRHAIGSDTHPLSILTNRIKINQYTPRGIEEFLDRLSNIHFKKNPQRFTNQNKWFDQKSLSCLSGILDEINKIPNNKKRDFYTMALCQIIRDVSKVDSRCVNHIIVDKNKQPTDVLNKFEKSVYRLKEIIRDFQKISTNSNMQIENMDARHLNVNNDEIDFMISHPPYASAVLYYNIYSLTSNMLGYDYEEIRKNDLSSGGFEGYLDNMKLVLKESHRVLKPNGYEALIVGDIRKNGDILTSLPYLIESGREIGFRLEDIFIWRLKHKAGMSLTRRGNHIDHNYILIFQKK